jgi:competence protein ComEA
MNERSRRFVLWLLMLAVSFILFLQGRPISHSREKVAFLPGRSAEPDGITIRLEGYRVKSGVYRFDCNQSLGTVINVTVPFVDDIVLDQSLFKKRLYTGDAVAVKRKSVQHVEIKRDNVPVVEKVILGIPLDPNRLTATEWEMLPRIGPSLAKKIIADRQENGDYLSIEGLERVPGIGAATIKQLESYFGSNVLY